ncbi:MAG: condensation domain-containing protein, partial [Burkholderiales bacterium]
RTVGWFTTLFPVCLGLGVEPPGEALKSVKEQLRAIPQGGIGYGVLRYGRPDPEVRTALDALPPAEVSFNYLGQWDPMLSDAALFGPARESSGPPHSPLGRRPHLLEVNGWVAEGRLHLEWSYSQRVHRRATVERLAQGFLEALEALIGHCRSPEAGGFTPSDFPLARLETQTLNRLPAKNVEDIYPLSPMQQGMLFHTLYAPESGVYFEQLSGVLDGDLEVADFAWAWQKVLERHPILRTAFYWEELNEPLQVVRARVTLPWVEEDWRGCSPLERHERLGAFLEADRARGFELGQAPLMRCALLREAEYAYRFVLGFHHLLMDGWSVSLLLKEVLAFYEAYCRGRELPLESPRPYRGYIAWLQQQDLAQAEGFWREALRGLTAPTPLPISRNEGARLE